MFYPKSPFFKRPDIESQIFKRNLPELHHLLEWLCITPKITTYRVNLLKTSKEKEKEKISNLLKAKYKNIPKVFDIIDIPELICISTAESCLGFEPELNEVIVDSSCASALLRGAHIYGPGVLAMPSGTKLNEVVNVFADLDGKCKKGTNCRYESDKKVFIGSGLVKMQRFQLYGNSVDPRGIAIEMNSTISSVPTIGDLSSKLMILQNFPSIICSRVLNPKPNEIILDMCAAPGNKTTHLAELTLDNATIIAIDKIPSKIERLKQKILNSELKSVHAYAFDSTKCLNSDHTNNSVKNLLNGPPFPCESFDRILLDAPCSALGNRPLLINNLSPKMLKSYPNLQKNLFKTAVGLLKPGGILVYSTCTITEEENESIIVWAKEKFPNLKLVSSDPIYGGIGIEIDGLSLEEREMVQRFGINNSRKEVDSVGFFIAKFIKDL